MFLTELDPRAAVRGSRDPLGFMTLWAHFGRYVVGNLTTQSTTVRGFTTLLLGYWLAERVQEERDTEVSTLDAFLRFEQIAAYCRLAINDDGRLRGIERVRKRLGESTRVSIGTDHGCQILGNQKIYGLWGLYSEPARASGYLDGLDRRPTPEASEFLDRAYVRDAWRGERAVINGLLRILAAPRTVRFDLDGRDAHLANAIARALRPDFTAYERKFYTETLVFGGADDPTHGRQRLLAELLREVPDEADFDMAVLETLIGMAGKRDGPGQDLAARLEAIRHVEGFIAPAASVFGFLQARDRKPVAAVAGAIRNAWGPRLRRVDPEAVAALRPELLQVAGSDASADRLVDVAQALYDGDYEALTHLLVQHNAAVMEARDGSQPWVTIDGGRLSVRMADESGGLPALEQLPTLWRNSYFIEALRTIRAELVA